MIFLLFLFLCEESYRYPTHHGENGIDAASKKAENNDQWQTKANDIIQREDPVRHAILRLLLLIYKIVSVQKMRPPR